MCSIQERNDKLKLIHEYLRYISRGIGLHREIMSAQEIFEFVAISPRNVEEAKEALPNLSDEAIKCLATMIKLLREGRVVFDNMLSNTCNNCGRPGHLAFMRAVCPLPYSRQNTRAYYNATPERQERYANLLAGQRSRAAARKYFAKIKGEHVPPSFSQAVSNEPASAPGNPIALPTPVLSCPPAKRKLKDHQTMYMINSTAESPATFYAEDEDFFMD